MNLELLHFINNENFHPYYKINLKKAPKEIEVDNIIYLDLTYMTNPFSLTDQFMDCKNGPVTINKIFLIHEMRQNGRILATSFYKPLDD